MDFKKTFQNILDIWIQHKGLFINYVTQREDGGPLKDFSVFIYLPVNFKFLFTKWVMLGNAFED